MENKSTFLKTTKKNPSIKRNKFHRILWLGLSIVFIALFVLLILYQSPESTMTFMVFHLTNLIFFFILLFLIFFSSATCITKSKIHGILFGSFIVIYFLFLLNHLTNLFFLILLLALFITLELFVINKR
jgi:hypothetical protein